MKKKTKSTMKHLLLALFFTVIAFVASGWVMALISLGLYVFGFIIVICFGLLFRD